MERLTKRDKDGTAIAPEFLDETYIMQDDNDEFTGYINSPIVERLAELEDEIENGTLVELPCKVGDTVYCVIQPDDEEPYIDDKYKCESLNYDGKWNITPSFEGWYWIIESVFATREEAEKRLEELKG